MGKDTSTKSTAYFVSPMAKRTASAPLRTEVHWHPSLAMMVSSMRMEIGLSSAMRQCTCSGADVDGGCCARVSTLLPRPDCAPDGSMASSACRRASFQLPGSPGRSGLLSEVVRRRTGMELRRITPASLLSTSCERRRSMLAALAADGATGGVEGGIVPGSSEGMRL